jgi:hypothetical protein
MYTRRSPWGAVVQKLSRRVIRTLRRLGYLEAGLDTAVATGYDSLVDDEPELARTMAASVQQRIAFVKRVGQRVQRIGSGFGHEGEAPTLTPNDGIKAFGHLSPAVPSPMVSRRHKPRVELKNIQTRCALNSYEETIAILPVKPEPVCYASFLTRSPAWVVFMPLNPLSVLRNWQRY